MSALQTLINRVEQARGTHAAEHDPELDDYYIEIPECKFVGWMDVEPGSRIEIEWAQYPGEEYDFPPLVDTGYIFLLPGQIEPHDTDAIFTEGVVHIPTPVGVEKESNEPEWVLLIDLLNNKQVECIRLV